jgi:hypothetical protein
MVARRSCQDDATGDPTVYIAASVRVELYADEHAAASGDRPFVTLYLPTDHVTLTRTFLFIRSPGVPASTYPLSSIRSFHVGIQPRPGDYDELRQQYPNAYEPWDAGDLAGLRHQHDAGTEIEQIAIRTGRPPEHIRVKLTAPEAPAVAGGPVRRREPAPLHQTPPEHRIDGSYIVIIQRGTDPLDVAARHGVYPTYVFRAALNGFAADMTGTQVGALRNDTDVDHVSEDAQVTLN